MHREAFCKVEMNNLNELKTKILKISFAADEKFHSTSEYVHLSICHGLLCGLVGPAVSSRSLETGDLDSVVARKFIFSEFVTINEFHVDGDVIGSLSL